MTKIGLYLSLVFTVIKLAGVTQIADWSFFYIISPLLMGAFIDLVLIAINVYYEEKAKLKKDQEVSKWIEKQIEKRKKSGEWHQ